MEVISLSGKPSTMRVPTHKSLIDIFDRIRTEKRVVRCSAQYEFPKLRIRKKKIVLVSMGRCFLCIRPSNTLATIEFLPEIPFSRPYSKTYLTAQRIRIQKERII